MTPFDELLQDDGSPRPVATELLAYLEAMSPRELKARVRAVDAAIKTMGITFTVYSDGENIDRAWPFDPVPRVIARQEWDRISRGLKQRLKALNCFIHDCYHQQRVVADGVLPAYILEESRNFRPQCRGITPPFETWAHVCGTDLVRDGDGTVYVLEDNLRVPSGVSYMLENRHVMKRVFPELFEHQNILPVNDYPSQLLDTLRALAPDHVALPSVAVLTPGIYNSAYFEHSYLARQMGADLVEGQDLFVADDDHVYKKTVFGPQLVDVIYRRIDDEFLDPEVFRADSALGVPGILRAWRAGNVAIANAPGAGVADDKVVYAYVPDFIRYYLGEEPLLPNVPTYLCVDPEDRAYVLEHLDELVVKPANESGGYGILVGPKASVTMRRRFARAIRQDPRNYIAQPTLALSTVPTLCNNRLQPRHVDLRPFVLQSESQYVTTGGLCRVALRRGSLVVNSSQGGGSKDTWIIDEEGR